MRSPLAAPQQTPNDEGARPTRPRGGGLLAPLLLTIIVVPPISESRKIRIMDIEAMDIRRLDLNLLVLLDALLASRNLSAAARSLGMSQPSASAGLSKLRHFFQDDLFVRTGRGLRPTPFAEGLQRPVRSVVDQINHDILTRAAFTPHESDRTFKLAMSDLGEVVFLPSMIERLHTEAPNVTLKCLKVSNAEVVNALETGALDLVIGNYANLSLPSIQSKLLYTDAFVCIAREGHPKARDGMSLDEFLDLEHLAFEPSGQQGMFMEGGGLGLKCRTLLQVPHFMSIPRLVAATDLVSIVPRSLAALFAAQYGLRLFEAPTKLPTVPLTQFWHRRIQNDPALAWLREIVSDAAATAEATWLGRRGIDGGPRSV